MNGAFYKILILIKSININYCDFQIITNYVYLFLSFFGGGRGSNLGPCIFYALSIPTELSSRRLSVFPLVIYKIQILEHYL